MRHCSTKIPALMSSSLSHWYLGGGKFKRGAGNSKTFKRAARGVADTRQGGGIRSPRKHSGRLAVDGLNCKTMMKMNQ